MTFASCDPTISTVYTGDCGGFLSPSCALVGEVYSLKVDNVLLPGCWRCVDGYYPDAIFGVLLPMGSPYESCNDCLQYNYKLYNCITSDVVYTNYLECPDCINWINDFAYTDIEPNPCWFITVTEEPVGTITPVQMLEGFCDPCDPSCYTITGTGTITYFNQYRELTTDDAPAIVCSTSYPSVSGTNYTITATGECSYRNPCPTYCYELTNCVTQEVIRTTNQDLAFPFVLNQIVEIAERDGCWSISRALVELCTGAIETTITQAYTDCQDCLPGSYYRLESCGNSDPIILYTSHDLSAYVGRTITLDNYIGCYNVTIYQGQVPSPVTIVFKNDYEDCIDCALPRYKLTDCDGVRNSIYTTTDLSSYLSSVIKLTFYPDTCWTVTTTTINSSDDLVIVDSEYTSCEICTTNTVCFCSTITNNSTETQVFQFRDCDNNLQSITLNSNETSRKFCVLKWIYPEDWDLPKIFTNDGPCVDGRCPSGVPLKTIRPGYNTPACSDQYYERIACSYANILYKDVISQRYGIAPCCDQDDIYRLHIKFQLLEMQAINNPDYICTRTKDCCHKDDSCGCGCNS
jgi:hypothetical protein